MAKLVGKTVSTVVVLFLFFYFAWVYIIPRLSEHEQRKYSRDEETRFVQRVVDGDTFVLENGERVRMLGIDTPEKFQSSKVR